MNRFLDQYDPRLHGWFWSGIGVLFFLLAWVPGLVGGIEMIFQAPVEGWDEGVRILNTAGGIILAFGLGLLAWSRRQAGATRSTAQPLPQTVHLKRAA